MKENDSSKIRKQIYDFARYCEINDLILLDAKKNPYKVGTDEDGYFAFGPHSEQFDYLCDFYDGDNTFLSFSFEGNKMSIIYEGYNGKKIEFSLFVYSLRPVSYEIPK